VPDAVETAHRISIGLGQTVWATGDRKETEEIRETEKREMEKSESELEKCLYNDVCLYSRPTRRSSVVYVLLMADAFVNSFYPRDTICLSAVFAVERYGCLSVVCLSETCRYCV